MLSRISGVDDKLQYLLDSDELHRRFQFSFRTSMRNLALYYQKERQLEKAAEAYLEYVKDILGYPFLFQQNLYFNSITLEYKEDAQKYICVNNLLLWN